MGNDYYTDDKGTLILIALLKQYGIKKVIASPGTGNMAIVVMGEVIFSLNLI